MRLGSASMVLLALTAGSPAASNPYGISDEMDRGLKQGFQELFNSQFDDAEKTLSALKPSKKEAPMAALAQVVRLWWEVSSDVMEVDAAASKPFIDAANDCLKISNEAISNGDNRGLAHLSMGTTLGLMSRWSAANRAWIPAYMRGSKSSNYLEKALAKNRRAFDAYMCMGTFNYARELIVSRTGSGEKDWDDAGKSGLGLEQLRKAYENGTYFRQASGLMLAGILTNEDPAKAVPLLKELSAQLPKSAFVHMVFLTALYNVGDIETMETESKVFFDKIESGEYPQSFLPQAQFAKGLIAFRKKEWKNAVEDFGAAAKHNSKRNPYVTWGHLYQGYAYDVLGQRTKAKEKYAVVLKLPRRFASHDHAKARTSKPFRPTDPEMKKLEV